MKKLLFCLVLICCMFAVFAQSRLPFSKGVNLLNWFEPWAPGEMPDLNKYDETDFAYLKSIGVDVVRLPVHFDLLMEPFFYRNNL